MNVDLAFVIGCAAAEKIAVANGGFKGGRSPKIERLRRLYIVVSVKEDGGLAGSFEGFGVDEGMKICRNNFDFLETGGAKIVRHPASRAFDVRFVFALGANAGDSQKFAEFRQMFVAITLYKFSKVRHGLPGAMSPFESNKIKNSKRMHVQRNECGLTKLSSAAFSYS